MDVHVRYAAILLSGLFLCSITAEEFNSDCLIVETVQTTSASRNELKEEIAEEIKTTLYASMNLASSIAKMQGELSELNKQLLAGVEPLLANQAPFKKASKESLLQTRNLLKKASEKLHRWYQSLARVRRHIARDALLRKSEIQ